MIEQELRQAIATAYWKAEQRWQAWRKQHPHDSRNGTDYSGSPEEDGIAADWKAFMPLMEEWERTYPAPPGHFWGIAYPSHEPELMKSATSVPTAHPPTPAASFPVVALWNRAKSFIVQIWTRSIEWWKGKTCGSLSPK